MWRFTDHLEEGDGGTICIRLADGFTDTREDAASAALAEIERIEPGLIERQLADWEKGWGSTHKFRAIVQRHRHESRAWAFVLNSEGITARALHRVHHVKPKAAKHCHAQADLGLIYTWVDNSDSDQFRPYWQEHRITKITLKRIFIHQHLNNSQTSLPREFLSMVANIGRVATDGGRAPITPKPANAVKTRLARSRQGNFVGTETAALHQSIQRFSVSAPSSHAPT